jgi:CheY-like chemotaxis protein
MWSHRTCSHPVVTANASQEHRDECLVAGMDDYLSQPICIAEFLDAQGLGRLAEATEQTSP